MLEASFEGCLHSVQVAIVLYVPGQLADVSADNCSFFINFKTEILVNDWVKRYFLD